MADSLQSIAGNRDGTPPPRCFICGKALAGRWFCHVPLEEGGSLLLCSPTCTLTYCKAVHPPESHGKSDSPATREQLQFV